MYAQASLDLETDSLAQLPEGEIAGGHHQTQLQTSFWGSVLLFWAILSIQTPASHLVRHSFFQRSQWSLYFPGKSTQCVLLT